MGRKLPENGYRELRKKVPFSSAFETGFQRPKVRQSQQESPKVTKVAGPYI